MDIVEGVNLSRAWLAALTRLAERPAAEAYDLVVEIAKPTEEEPEVRRLADALLRPKDWSIDTTANTIFPAALAASSRSLQHLTTRYLALKDPIHRAARANSRGTYFERLIAYPLGNRAVNQLANVLKRGRESPRLGFVYELNLHVPGIDSRPMGFPCLSYVNVKLRKDELLMTAHYRNHYFVARAYGNYLGLGRLQEYLARALGVRPGPLICISGHAQIDPGRVRQVRAALLRGVP